MIWIIVLLLAAVLFLLELTCGVGDVTMAAIRTGTFFVLLVFCYYVSRILSRIVGIRTKSAPELPRGIAFAAMFFIAGFVVIFLAEILIMNNAPAESVVDALRASGLALVVYEGLLPVRKQHPNK